LLLVFYASLTPMLLPFVLEVDEGALRFSLGTKFQTRHPQINYEWDLRMEKTMKPMLVAKMTLIVIGGICAAMPAAAQSFGKADVAPVSITGKVSCTKFGRGSITARKGMSVAQTIWYCATFQGGDYSVVSGNKIYRLAGDKNMLAKLAGENVTVGGHMLPEQTDEATVALMGTVEVSDVARSKD
jgi:hypothetical protein